MNWIKRQKKLLLIASSVLLSVLCLIGYFSVSGTLDYVDSAEKWRGESETPYSYISCFMPVNGKIDENSVWNFKNTVDSKLIEASLSPSENGSLWNFSYCGTGTVEVFTERGTAKVNAVGTGGDFFFFHEYKLHDGSYISGNDLMKDKVVIDKELAWKLFGATKVAGMEILINESRYIIAGVIERETDFASREAETADGGLFMAYEKLEEITGVGIDCYEAVIPDPVSGFAKKIAEESFPAENFVAVEVTGRYGIENMADIILSFGKRSMRTDGVIFPEWENAARLTEDYSAVLLLFAFVFGAGPAVFGAVMLIKYGKKYGRKAVLSVKEKAEKLVDDHNRKIYEKNLSEKNR